MTAEQQNIPIETLHLFPILDKLLIDLLKSLSAEEWNSPTIAKLWTVKDIASHLLDGNLKTLSISRDKYFGEPPAKIDSYIDLVSFINEINMAWTRATIRLSPTVLIELLEITGKEFSNHLSTLRPFDEAIFSVAWAGQTRSENWFHIAREYTEKFLHQQQIRDAVGKQALFTKELFYPFIDILMGGLPHTYRDVQAQTGTVVRVTINSEIGGEWNLLRAENSWELSNSKELIPDAMVNIDPDDAWKLFSKGLSAEKIIDRIEITGDRKLGEIALSMISVMA